ncbi:MAG TPA: DUF427 domain-containing protein [Streptosporangiaceae bacterium]|jgi:uncharacterized protein (DUF427 family)
MAYASVDPTETGMSLTHSPGPLAGRPPATVNYTIEGPKHRLLLHDFPRRVRAVFAGETVLDTERGALLHETGLPAVLYVPMEDVRGDLLTPTDHSTHCPFKGDASYWTIRVGDRAAENAIWGYPEPKEAASWLAGRVAFYWDRMDAWYDEDEEVRGSLRNPYHRVDVRATSRKVRVLADGEVIAETGRPMLLSETGLPNRYYIPREDVRDDVLRPSDTETVCPYKGTAEYWSVRLGDTTLDDAVWSYPDASDDASRVRGYLSFGHNAITVEVSPR